VRIASLADSSDGLLQYQTFTDAAAAKEYIKEQGAPIVIKADGLAAGKGVIVAMSLDEAFEAVDSMLVKGAFGSAGSRVIVEEFLKGEEASFFALVDGENAVPLESAQDHKRVGDGDMGPNTGGMGAYSPAPVLTKELQSVVMESIIIPTVKGMVAEGCKFVGVLYAGLMIEKKSGLPKLIEYNVRFGDPECQVSVLKIFTHLLWEEGSFFYFRMYCRFHYNYYALVLTYRLMHMHILSLNIDIHSSACFLSLAYRMVEKSFTRHNISLGLWESGILLLEKPRIAQSLLQK